MGIIPGKDHLLGVYDKLKYYFIGSWLFHLFCCNTNSIWYQWTSLYFEERVTAA